jgi:hypothetical protein
MIPVACLPVVLHLAASELAIAVGPEGGGTEGICVKVLKVLGSPA